MMVVGCARVVQPVAPPAAAVVAACVPIHAACDPAISDATMLGVVTTRCVPCHGERGISGYPFTTAEALAAAPVADLASTCEMPPDGAAPLTARERAIVVGWGACRAMIR